MLFSLNFKSGLPVYLQLAEQVKAAAASGALRPGEQLPGIRPLAEELRVNRNTVAKAYAELETQGVVENIQGKGCFLADARAPLLKKDARRQLLVREIDQAVVQAHHLQVPPAEFLALVRERLDALAARQREHEETAAK